MKLLPQHYASIGSMPLLLPGKDDNREPTNHRNHDNYQVSIGSLKESPWLVGKTRGCANWEDGTGDALTSGVVIVYGLR
jgi:hypothetical protein